MLDIKVRIFLTEHGDTVFMGIGVYRLLRGIEHGGSIRKSAEAMNMSYSKALRMLKDLEQSLGRELLERQKGGNNRTGTTLTPYGEHFLKAYEKMDKDIAVSATAIYRDFLKEIVEFE